MRLWLGAPFLLLALLGCDSRFPVCRTEEDCAVSKLGKHCYDLRCVGCRNDTDCEIGQICGGDHTCESLGGTTPRESATAVSVEPTPEPTETARPRPPKKKPAPASGHTPRDPKAWEACVKACDTTPCVDACDKQYD